jgi:hypothetical protein
VAGWSSLPVYAAAKLILYSEIIGCRSFENCMAEFSIKGSSRGADSLSMGRSVYDSGE